MDISRQKSKPRSFINKEYKLLPHDWAWAAPHGPCCRGIRTQLSVDSTKRSTLGLDTAGMALGPGKAECDYIVEVGACMPMHILMRLALMKVLSFKVNRSPSFVSVQDNVQKAERQVQPDIQCTAPKHGMKKKKNPVPSDPPEVCLINLILNKDSRLIIICKSPFRKVNTKQMKMYNPDLQREGSETTTTYLTNLHKTF